MALLECKKLTVRFGGHMAVNEVDLDVAAGQVTGLIGPNGAGKTTTFNMICGLIPATRGVIRLDGDDIGKLPAHKRARRGMARTFQRLELFNLLSVRENVLAAAAGTAASYTNVAGGILRICCIWKKIFY